MVGGTRGYFKVTIFDLEWRSRVNLSQTVTGSLQPLWAEIQLAFFKAQFVTLTLRVVGSFHIAQHVRDTLPRMGGGAKHRTERGSVGSTATTTRDN